MALTLSLDYEFSLVAFDQDGRPVLLAEIKALKDARKIARPWLVEVAEGFRLTGAHLPYWMIVDPEEILVFSGDPTESSEPAFTIPTAEVVKVYSLREENGHISNFYLVALINHWLDRFAYDWMSPEPPAMAEFGSIGLADRLKGGMIRREVPVAALYPVRGDEFLDESLFRARFGDR